MDVSLLGGRHFPAGNEAEDKPNVGSMFHRTEQEAIAFSNSLSHQFINRIGSGKFLTRLGRQHDMRPRLFNLQNEALITLQDTLGNRLGSGFVDDLASLCILDDQTVNQPVFALDASNR